MYVRTRKLHCRVNINLFVLSSSIAQIFSSCETSVECKSSVNLCYSSSLDQFTVKSIQDEYSRERRAERAAYVQAEGRFFVQGMFGVLQHATYKIDVRVA